VKPVKAITVSDSGTLSNAIGSMAQKIGAAAIRREVTKRVVEFAA